jgi:hypothetical protein
MFSCIVQAWVGWVDNVTTGAAIDNMGDAIKNQIKKRVATRCIEILSIPSPI